MLSPTYEITTALSHTDELISPPYDIAIVTISYGRVTMSSVWDSMMSKKNMGWPFYAAVIFKHFHSGKCVWKCRLRNGGRFVSASLCVNVNYTNMWCNLRKSTNVICFGEWNWNKFSCKYNWHYTGRLYAKHRRQHMTSPITKIHVSTTVGYGCEDTANTT